MRQDAGVAGFRALPRAAEVAFWLTLVAGFWLWPSYLALWSQILIAGLFALSYDLVLGYAGIVSLGHAAYFGIGAYAAGVLSRNGWGAGDYERFALSAAAWIVAGARTPSVPLPRPPSI